MVLVKLFEWFCSFWAWLKGWKILGGVPKDLKKGVIIVVPHTSNWDFIYGMATKFHFKLEATYFAKKELFKWPLKTVLQKTGALPVDRSSSKDMVGQAVDAIKKAGQMYVVIAPEGTRSHTEKWKTGFYHIALQANIPIMLAYIDYAKKETAIDEIYYPTGDKEKDFAYFKEYYSKITGRNPEYHNKEKLL